MDDATPQAVCRVCRSPSQSDSTGRIINDYALARCQSCGTVMVDSILDADELAKLYDELFADGDYQQYRDELKRLGANQQVISRYRQYLLNRVARLADGRRMIEIGVGSGAFGYSASAQGWQYVGYDISQVAVDYAIQNGLDAHTFDANGLPALATNSADVVIMWEVIEHLWDVAGYLERIRQALRPNGVLLLSTPNYLRPAYQKSEWGVAMAPPVHVNFFTVDSLATCLQRSGFDSVAVYKRTLYPPAAKKISAVTKMARLLLRLEEPPTLYAIVRKS